VSRLFLTWRPSPRAAGGGSGVESLALYERNRQMIDIGAYTPGTNPPLDRAMEIVPA